MPRGFAGEERREAREAADRQREAVDRLMERQAGRSEAERFARAAQAQQMSQQAEQQRQQRIGQQELARFQAATPQPMMFGASPLAQAVNKQISDLRFRQSGYPVYGDGRVVGVAHETQLPGLLGAVASNLFDFQPMAYTGLRDYDPFDSLFRSQTEFPEMRMDTVTPSVTEEPTTDCPPGYRYDPILKSCVVSFEPTFYQPTQSFGFEDLGLLGTYPNTILG